MSVQSQTHRVDPSHYNSKLDADDDWTEALQWANDKLVASHGGGEIQLPPFRIYISDWIQYDSKIVWRGYGPQSIVQVADGATGGFKSRGFDTLIGTNSTEGVYETGFKYLTIHGNKENGSFGSGMLHYGTSQSIHDVFVREFQDTTTPQANGVGGVGFFSEWASGNAYGVVGAAAGAPPATRVGRSLESRWSKITAQDCENKNIWMNGPHDSFIHDVASVQQYLNNKTVDNFLVDTKAGGAQISKVHCWGGDSDYGLNINTSACRLVDICCEGAQLWQMRIGTVQGGSPGGCFLSGAHLFGQPAAGSTQGGLKIEAMVSGTLTNLKFNNCPGGIIDWTGDLGNSHVQGVANDFSPDPVGTKPLFVGSPNPRTTVDIKMDPTIANGRGLKIVNSTNQQLGFFGNTTPVAKQTGVPVTAAGIHAALVAYGLIT